MVVGGRFENTQRGGERRNAQELSQMLVEEGDNDDQKNARGIRDGLIKRFIPNSKLSISFMIVSFYRDQYTF